MKQSFKEIIEESDDESYEEAGDEIHRFILPPQSFEALKYNTK
jgi:hypothetical protein